MKRRGGQRRSDRLILLEAFALGLLMLLGLASAVLGYLEGVALP